MSCFSYSIVILYIHQLYMYIIFYVLSSFEAIKINQNQSMSIQIKTGKYNIVSNSRFGYLCQIFEIVQDLRHISAVMTDLARETVFIFSHCGKSYR